MLRLGLLIPCLFGLASGLETPLAGYNISWALENDHLTLTLEVETDGWIGFGIASGSGMRGADIVRVDGSGGIEDGYSLDEGPPRADCTQDWEILCREVEGGVTKVLLRRALDTGDTQDHAIVDDGFDTLIILAFGSYGQSSFEYHGQRRTPMSLNFFGKTSETSISELKADPDVTKIDFFMHNGEFAPYVLPVPGNVDNVTTYINVCTELPADLIESGGYLVGFEKYIQPGSEDIVHHFVVYGSHKSCAELGGFVGRWNTNGFKTVWPWAVGTGNYVLPSNMGFPVGGGSNVVALVMNVHYDNPSMEQGREDSSGVVVYFTKLPRTYFMGTIQLGDPRVALSGDLVLAEGSKSTMARHNFNCPRNFFLEAWQSGNVKIMGSLLHMHRSGVYMRTEIVDWMGREKHAWKRDYYDGDWQIIVGLNNIEVEPGDQVKVTCVFDDAKRSSIVDTLRFGQESADEMCIDFVFFYTDSQEALDSIHDQYMCGIDLGVDNVYHSSSPVDNVAEELGIAFGRPPPGFSETCDSSGEMPPELTYSSYAVGGSTINVGQLGGNDAETTIVALHGFPQASLMWFGGFAQELMNQLAPLRARVIAPDLRGVNRTMPKYPCEEMGCDAYTPKVITDETANLLILHFQAMENPVHLIGHDWGAAIAWRIAILYPSLVQTLAVADVAHPSVFRQFLTHDVAQISASGYAGYFAESDIAYNDSKPMASRPDSGLIMSVIMAAPDMEYKYKDAWLHEDSLRSHFYWYRGSAAFDKITEGINESNMVVALPVLQLWGEKDEAVLPSQICCLKSVATSLHVKVFEGVGHWLIDERPRKVAEIVASHINGNLETDPCSAVEDQCTSDRQRVCDAEPALPPHGCNTSRYPEPAPSCEMCRGQQFNPEVSFEDDGEQRSCQDTLNDVLNYCGPDLANCDGECQNIQRYLSAQGCCGQASECDFCPGSSLKADASYVDPNSGETVPCSAAAAYCSDNLEACGGCAPFSGFLSAQGCCNDGAGSDNSGELCDFCPGSSLKADASYVDPNSGETVPCGAAAAYCSDNLEACGGCAPFSGFLSAQGCCNDGAGSDNSVESCDLCSGAAVLSHQMFSETQTCAEAAVFCTVNVDDCGGCAAAQSAFNEAACCFNGTDEGTCDFCAGSPANLTNAYVDDDGKEVRCSDAIAHCTENIWACRTCAYASAFLADKGCCMNASGDRRLSAKSAEMREGALVWKPRLLQSAPQTCKAYFEGPTSAPMPAPTPAPTPAPRVKVEKTVELDKIPEDADAFLDDILSTIASEQGVEVDEVSVESMEIVITVGYSFPDTVTAEDVRAIVAAAVDLPIDQVIIVSSGGGRRLIAVQHLAQLITHDFSAAAVVNERAIDVSKLTKALQDIHPEAEAPVVTEAPKVDVKISTSVPGSTVEDTDASAAHLSSCGGDAFLISLLAMAASSMLP